MLKDKNSLKDFDLVEQIEDKAAEMIEGSGKLEWKEVLGPNNIPQDAVIGGYSATAEVELHVCRAWYKGVRPGLFIGGGCHFAYYGEHRVVPTPQPGDTKVEILTHL